MSVLEAEGLLKRYGGRQVVNGISLKIGGGEVVEPFIQVVHFEDRHVAAGAAALVEQPLHGRCRSNR